MKLKAIIDRIEDKKVVLVTESSREIIIDRSLFTEEIKEGDVLSLQIVKNKKLTGQKEKKTRNLLNKILTRKNG